MVQSIMDCIILKCKHIGKRAVTHINFWLILFIIALVIVVISLALIPHLKDAFAALLGLT